MRDEPTFAERERLARYIAKIERMSGHRPAATAFLSNLSANPNERHLSVNSMEVESVRQIAAYYRLALQADDDRVAVCIHSVAHYNEAGRDAGATISYDHSASQWQFGGPKGVEAAYRHRPGSRSSRPPDTPSHCGVEFVRALDELNQRRFSRRLAMKGRFHWC